MSNSHHPLSQASVSGDIKSKNLRKRYAREQRFHFYGLFAVVISFVFLFFLLGTIMHSGYSAFFYTKIKLKVTFAEDVIDPSGERNPDVLREANYRKIIKRALREEFPEVSGRNDKKKLMKMISRGASSNLYDEILHNPEIIGTTKEVELLASADIDMLVKGKISVGGKVSEKQALWLDTLAAKGKIVERFNFNFFTNGDSRTPEKAGILGSFIGSLFTLIVCMASAVPVGVGAAVYMEKFAPKNRFTDMMEVNINNLAAVPSIIFGLLALAIFLNVFGLPRSSSLVGGFALAILVLPIIIVTTRNALAAVPSSIEYAAAGLGASRVQVLFHHTLPLAMPGIMTGTILAMARALGETAPLIMIGMVAFVADIPKNFLDPSTALPVQVYLWADSPEVAFAEKTSAAIIILLLLLILLNIAAILLRRKYERKW